MFKKTANPQYAQAEDLMGQPAIFQSMVITGGHHSSALPVIDILLQKIPNLKINWIGHKYSMQGDKNPTLEFHEITALKIPFYELQAGKFYKTFNIVRLLKIPFGFLHALYLLNKLKPQVVLSFGGYLAVPVVIAAKLMGIATVTHEQTVVTGYANKLIGKFADKVFVSWESSKKYFDAKKVILTGLPLRKELFNVNSNDFELNKELPTVFVLAGKTGSHKINTAVEGCLSELLSIANVIHQSGDHSEFNDFERLQTKYLEIKDAVKGQYNLRKFILNQNIGEAYSKASFVVSRAGAHITAELLALNKPAILIPIPWVSHNEQMENALNVKNSGLGIILEESVLTAEKLLDQIRIFSKTYRSYSLNNDPLINKNAAENIVAEIIKLYAHEN